MDGYELLPDPGDDWSPTKAHVRRQREREELHEHAERLAAEAPPLSEEGLQRVVTLLLHKTPPSDLVEWRLRLFCGHVIGRTSHVTHTTVHSAFMGGIECPECGLDPATIIAAQAVRRLEVGEPARPVLGADAKALLRRHRRDASWSEELSSIRRLVEVEDRS